MRRRDVYLKIEKIRGYSPVMPAEEEHDRYGRDCMRGHGHADTIVPAGEIEQRRLDAVVYREYTDSTYTTAVADKLIDADVNEPAVDRRVPGAVLYAEPGERLYVHVLNADDGPHSFHVHGLVYGIDSDGSWPFGVSAADGRRSDEICPEESWTYVFDVGSDTIGAWPFHDHSHHVVENVHLGLFGAIVVRDPDWAAVDHEIPLFLHRLDGPRRVALFDSGTLAPATAAGPGGAFVFTFPRTGEFSYTCRFHAMTGVVRVVAGGPPTASVDIVDNQFQPPDVTVGVGAQVTWRNLGIREHTATETGGGALSSYALNGRTYVGNTPTIVVRSGERLRWYVFNLDLEVSWHNFHLHGMRWRHGGELIDARALSPAESFVMETVAPPVVLLPETEDEYADPPSAPASASPARSLASSRFSPVHATPGLGGATGHGGVPNGSPGHGGGGHGNPAPHPHPGGGHGSDGGSDTVRVRGDFLIHCHVEQHMMEGMVGLVRVVQDLPIAPGDVPDVEARLGYSLPVEVGLGDCPDVDPDRCRPGGGTGRWEQLPDLDIFTVHAALLHTGKVLLWSGTAEVGNPLVSRLWEPDGTITGQSFGEDLFCSGQATMADGRLCVAGGSSTPGTGIRSTHIFDPTPGVESWTKVADMAAPRWYPTLVELADGRILAVSGRGGPTPEVFDGTSWQPVAGATRDFPELYPSLNLIPSGDVFYSRCGWEQSDLTQPATGYLRMTGPAAGTWASLAAQAFPDRQEGMAVLQVDDSVTPAAVRLFLFGGGYSGQANAQSGEVIDLSVLAPTPSWARTADMTALRVNVNATLLPDGRILVVGGHRSAGRFGANDPVFEPEIYDPVLDSWSPQPPMLFPRGYHSVAVLIPDGRVLTAGGPGGPGGFDNQLNMEIFSPPYLFAGPRPQVTGTPADVGYGDAIPIDTPDEPHVESVTLLRPGAVTHHTDANARFIRLAITARGAGQITARAPSGPTVAPPGYYMLFVVNSHGVPSVGRFVLVR